MVKAIFGIGHFAELVYSYLAENEKNVPDCFTVSGEYIDNTKSLPLPIVPFHRLSSYFNCSPANIEILICVGYNEMNSIRQTVFQLVSSKGHPISSFIHSSAVVSSKAKVGKGCILLENAVIQPFADIGFGNIIWSNAVIAHHAQVGNFNFFAPSVSVAGDTVIGDCCFIGNNATIRNGVAIGDSCLIGAGCYITGDIESKSVLLAPRPFLSEKCSDEYRTI